jgi:hypothetical protein
MITGMACVSHHKFLEDVDGRFLASVNGMDKLLLVWSLGPLKFQTERVVF